MSYIDVMVIPVPTAKLKDYKKLVKKSAAAWKRAGAIAYIEAIADDVKWSCPQLIPHPVLIYADNRSNLTGDVPPIAECLRRVL
jgi:uncharacterized protein YbaA (DUF1428 family)